MECVDSVTLLQLKRGALPRHCKIICSHRRVVKQNHSQVYICHPLSSNTQVGTFDTDNRAGIDATLHRISCMRNRGGRVVGLTCRVGRAIQGSASLVEDLVRAGKSVLLLGRPGAWIMVLFSWAQGSVDGLGLATENSKTVVLNPFPEVSIFLSKGLEHFPNSNFEAWPKLRKLPV